MVNGKQSKLARKEEKKVLRRFEDVLSRAGLPDDAFEVSQGAQGDSENGTEPKENGGANDQQKEETVKEAEDPNKQDQVEERMEEGEVTEDDILYQEPTLEGPEYVCVERRELQTIARGIQEMGDNQLEIIKFLKTVMQRQSNLLEYTAKNDDQVAKQLTEILAKLAQNPAPRTDQPCCSSWAPTGPRNAQTPVKNGSGGTPAKRRFLSSDRREMFRCVYCDCSDHSYHDQCFRFRRVGERIAILKKKGLCTVCLARDHPGAACRSLLGTPRRCHHCHEENAHHSSCCPSDEHRDRLDALREEDFKKN